METRSNGATEKNLRDSEVTEAIIGCAIQVHQALGPGLLESVYESCLAFELQKAGLHVERQKTLPVVYKDYTYLKLSGMKTGLLINFYTKLLKDGIHRIVF